METRTIGSLTEIYISGGGNFVTQAYPTNFHTFHTRKVLVGDEKPGDFKEVTAAERARIEAEDAKWEKPDHTLVYLAEINGAVYNKDTGFFELNGLTDITAPQMKEIVKAGRFHSQKNTHALAFSQIRTNFEPRISMSVQQYERTFFQCSNLEIAVVNLMYDGVETFRECKKLRKILKFHGVRENGITANVFRGCDLLEEIQNFVFKTMSKDCAIGLQYLPAIGLPTLSALVESKNKPEWQSYKVTVAVHPDIFAKLTDETNTEWHQVMLDATEKNIQFTTL